METPGDERDSAAELVGGFPRHATRDLVEASEERHRLRRPLAAALIAAGATLLALGLPEARLAGPGPGLVDALADGHWASARAAFLPLTQLADALPRVQAERAAFLVAALAYGALALATWRLGRRLDATPHARVMTTLLVLTAPAVWIAGRSPGPEVLAMLGATLCFVALANPARSYRRTFAAGGAWCLAVGASPVCVWLLPAVAWAVPRGAGPLARVLRALVFGVVTLLAWLGATLALHWFEGTALWGFRDLAFGLLRDALAGDAAHFDARWAWVPFAATGVASFGAIGLVVRDADGRRAPGWVFAWLALPLGVAVAFGRVDWELPLTSAVPVLAYGLYRSFASLPFAASRAVTLGLLVVAPATAIAATLAWRAGDDHAAWRAVLERDLSRGDVLLTTSLERRHLATRRYGMRAFEIGQTARLSPGYRREEVRPLVRRLARIRAAGGRVVLDRRLAEDEVELRELVRELAEGGPIDPLSYDERRSTED